MNTRTPIKEKTFRDWLNDYKSKNDESLKGLSKKTGVSVGALHLYLKAKKRKQPKPQTAMQIARGLGLSATERIELWRVMKVDEKGVEGAAVLIEGLEQIAANSKLTARDKSDLYAALTETIGIWKADLKREIHVAVIAMAGWQRSLLASERQVVFLEHSIIEVMRAKIKEVVAVVGPGQEALLKGASAYASIERLTRQGVRVEYALQDKPGLGHAVIVGAKHFGCIRRKEAFVLAFPDEFSVEPCLQKMIECYQDCQKTIVAVSEITAGKMEERGGVAYHDVTSPEEGHLIDIDTFAENPVPLERKGFKAYKIFGRYVISPACIEALEDESRRSRTQSDEHFNLTSSLIRLTQRKEKDAGGLLVGETRKAIRPLSEELEKALKELDKTLQESNR